MGRVDMQLVRPDRHWYDDRDNLADLIEYLGPTVDIPYVLRKPWKWEAEYQAMRREEEMDRIADEHAALEDEAFRDMERRASL